MAFGWSSRSSVRRHSALSAFAKCPTGVVSRCTRNHFLLSQLSSPSGEQGEALFHELIVEAVVALLVSGCCFFETAQFDHVARLSAWMIAEQILPIDKCPSAANWNFVQRRSSDPPAAADRHKQNKDSLMKNEKMHAPYNIVPHVAKRMGRLLHALTTSTVNDNSQPTIIVGGGGEKRRIGNG